MLKELGAMASNMGLKQPNPDMMVGDILSPTREILWPESEIC